VEVDRQERKEGIGRERYGGKGYRERQEGRERREEEGG
jgi:hypothetical protein